MSAQEQAQHQLNTVTDLTAAGAGVGFPLAAWFDLIAAGLAIPVALLSIVVLIMRIKKEWRNRRFRDQPVEVERRKSI